VAILLDVRVNTFTTTTAVTVVKMLTYEAVETAAGSSTG
jgi:hypothetical protein